MLPSAPWLLKRKNAAPLKCIISNESLCQAEDAVEMPLPSPLPSLPPLLPSPPASHLQPSLPTRSAEPLLPPDPFTQKMTQVGPSGNSQLPTAPGDRGTQGDFFLLNYFQYSFKSQ